MKSIDIHSVFIGLKYDLYEIPPETKEEVIGLVELYGQEEGVWDDGNPDIILGKIQKAQSQNIQRIKIIAPVDIKQRELVLARRVYLAICKIRRDVRIILDRAA